MIDIVLIFHAVEVFSVEIAFKTIQLSKKLVLVIVETI